MKKIFLILSILFFTSCSTLKVDVDYDTAYDFTGKTKYSVIHNYKPGENTLINDRIIEAIKNSLNAKGYTEVAKGEGDLLFMFHANVQRVSDITTDYQMVGGFGMGFGRYGRYGGGMVETPTVSQWNEGKLIIDALNPKTKKIVWRGVATDELSDDSTTPAQKTAYINKAVAKILEKFPKD